MKKVPIELLADYIIENYNNENICVVFPSIRAGLYLKNALLKKNNNPIIIPKIFSINEFIEYFSNAKMINNIEGIFILYKLYKEMNGNESFDVFFNMANIMLKDFSDIDRMIVDDNKIKKFFDNLKNIIFMDINENENNPYIKKHIDTVTMIDKLYNKFNSYLKEHNKCYLGLCYKLAYNNIKNNKIPYSKIIFAGFNALTNIEKYIFKELSKQNICEFLWDSDTLIDNDKNLSGYFIVENKKDFSSIIDNIDTLHNEKEVNIISAMNNVEQSLILKDILTKKYSNVKDESIGIVLMNEGILLPILYALPKEKEKFNITMGLSFKYTPIFEIIKLLFDMHVNRITMQSKGFYANDIKKLLNHPYIKKMFDKDLLNNINKELNNAINNGYQYVEFSEDIIKSIPFIFKDFQNSTQILNELELLVKNMLNIFNNSINREYVIPLYETLRECKEYFNSIEDISLNTVFNVLLSIFSNISIPFSGEPLRGIQIMGLLETRILAFKHLIILSANDNYLPGKSNDSSFIPNDIKYMYGIFTNKEKDIIFAYHFFRLLKYADSIDIIYTEQNDEQVGLSMRSRFIDYILWNNKREGIGENWNIKEIIYTNNQIIKSGNRRIKKDKRIIEELLKKTYSASSITNYMICPYKFFIANILNVDIEDDYAVNMDRGSFGTLLHKVFEKLYTQYSKGIYDVINDNDFNDIYDNLIKDTIKNDEKLKKFNVNSGKNKLMVDIGKILIRNIINTERETREDIEFNNNWKFEYKLDNIYLNVEQHSIKLTGYIDRLELYDNNAIIIDYKTGRSSKITFEVLDDFEEQKMAIIKNKEAFQLLFYIYMLNKTGLNKKNYMAYIYDVSNNKINKLKFEDRKIINNDSIERFENLLVNIMKEILSDSIDFVSMDRIEGGYGECRYCKYQSICRGI